MSPQSGTLLLAMAANAKRLVQYEWKQRITVVRNGRPSEPIICKVSFNSSGEMQRTTMSAPPPPGENILITEFQASSESSRRPGAAETMGSGAAPEVAAATSGVTERKQNVEGDASRMAKAVSKEITKTPTAQGWIRESK